MKKLLAILLLSMVILTGCDNKPFGYEQANGGGGSTPSSTPSTTPSNMEIHYIDVGQADSTLVVTDRYSMLIDAGNNADGQDVVNFIRGKGISKLDIVVGTHPHEDHIGGMDDVIDAFDVDKIIMPKVSHTSKTYKDVLSSIQASGNTIHTAKAGQTYRLGEANLSILSPIQATYDELNENSVVMRMEFGKTSFLFTGDMEKANETEVLASGAKLKSDVLKVAHHGSRTSSTSGFLKAVSPTYGIIMVGAGNDYNHPHTNVLSRLKNMMTVYRTDTNGTITVSTDGSNITVKTAKGGAA